MSDADARRPVGEITRGDATPAARSLPVISAATAENEDAGH
jgi:hypothetical protein